MSWLRHRSNNAWFLVRDGAIFLIARFGTIYSPDGVELGKGQLGAYAKERLGVPDDVPCVSRVDDATYAKIERALTRLPAPAPRPVREPREVEKVIEKVVEVAPTPPPVVTVEAEVRKKPVLRNRPAHQIKDPIIEAIENLASGQNWTFHVLRDRTIIEGQDRHGGKVMAMYRNGIISPYEEDRRGEQPRGIGSMGGDRWFASQVQNAIDKQLKGGAPGAPPEVRAE